MKAKPDDLILAEVTAIGSGYVRGRASQIGNIEEVIIEDTDSAKLVPGQAVTVRLQTLEDGRGNSIIEQGRYRRHYFPGDTVDVTAKEPIQSNVCRAPSDKLGNIDTLYVVGVTPETHARVRIDLVRDRIAFARPISVHSQGIETGDVLPARTVSESQRAELTRKDYPIVLDEFAKISTDIKVKIADISDKIHGKIAEAKQLPITGNQVRAETQPDTKTAKARPAGYEIELDRHVHTSQGVTIQITDILEDDGTIRGEIVDDSPLPSVGDQVSATSVEDARLADAEAGYSIEIDRYAHCETNLIVELTDVGSTIQGQVVESGNLPDPGDVIRVSVSQGKQWAQCSEYAVSLDNRALLDGEFRASVVEVDGASRPRVEIISYEGKLPSVGSTFVGTAHPRSDTVEVDGEPYDVSIPDGVERYGQATGHLVQVENRIEGEIDEITTNRTITIDDQDPVGSKNDLIHNTSL